jgi:phosphoacetylglucosamine mutase
MMLDAPICGSPAAQLSRCGILLAVRALKTKQVTGICITASHNPAEDNGVKLVEPNGEMLCQDWEVRSAVCAF